MMSSWQGLSVGEWLHGSMVVVLMNLTVVRFSSDFMSVWLDGLGGDGGSHNLLYVSEVASARSVPGDSSLSSLHCYNNDLVSLMKLIRTF